MTSLLYVPSNEEDARQFNSSILDSLIEKDEELWEKAIKIIPTWWVGRAYSKYEWKKDFLSIYNNLDIDDSYYIELPSSIDFYTLNHRFIDRLNKNYEEDFFNQIFLSPIASKKMYFLHPIYELYIFKEKYYETIFSEKLYFWRKLLVELGATSINISMLSIESKKMSSVFSVGLSNDAYNLKYSKSSANENIHIKESKSIFHHPDNVPDEKYLSVEEDDFDENGDYLFPYEKSEIESYKLYCWVYNDDKELQHIFETRLKQIRTNNLSELKFNICCRFKDISINKNEEEILLNLGIFGKNEFSEIDKTQVVLNLEVNFSDKKTKANPINIDKFLSEKQDQDQDEKIEPNELHKVKIEVNDPAASCGVSGISKDSGTQQAAGYVSRKELKETPFSEIQIKKLITPQKPLSKTQAKKIQSLKKAHEQGFLSDEDLEREIEKV